MLHIWTKMSTNHPCSSLPPPPSSSPCWKIPPFKTLLAMQYWYKHLLAPTGALIVIMCYNRIYSKDPQTQFSNFHWAHWKLMLILSMILSMPSWEVAAAAVATAAAVDVALSSVGAYLWRFSSNFLLCWAPNRSGRIWSNDQKWSDNFWPHKNSPFCQENFKLVIFTPLS